MKSSTRFSIVAMILLALSMLWTSTAEAQRGSSFGGSRSSSSSSSYSSSSSRSSSSYSSSPSRSSSSSSYSTPSSRPSSGSYSTTPRSSFGGTKSTATSIAPRAVTKSPSYSTTPSTSATSSTKPSSSFGGTKSTATSIAPTQTTTDRQRAASRPATSNTYVTPDGKLASSKTISNPTTTRYTPRASTYRGTTQTYEQSYGRPRYNRPYTHGGSTVIINGYDNDDYEFMQGYLAGQRSTSWYQNEPQMVRTSNGQTAYYPPTTNWGAIAFWSLLGIGVLGGGTWLLMRRSSRGLNSSLG